MNDSKCLPFLKWAGGKRWLAPRLSEYIKEWLSVTNGQYIEPFLGGGAVFFSVSPGSSIISDVNLDLINCYNSVRDEYKSILRIISTWPVSKEHYYSIRIESEGNDIYRACRFLYLNRTCYGGIYRENKKGQFNVPYGGGQRTHFALWESNLLENASNILKGNVEILVSDFEDVLNRAKGGDVVYCDPTYTTVDRLHFDRYGKCVFNWDDQMRLASAVQRAYSRGALVLVSNAFCRDITPLYKGATSFHVTRNKGLGKTSNSSREVLYVLDPNLEFLLNLREDEFFSLNEVR